MVPPFLTVWFLINFKKENGSHPSSAIEASDITSLPFKMKQKWLENANQRIEEKEEDNARRAAAMKALQTGNVSGLGTPGQRQD